MDRKRRELASRWAQELGIVYDNLKNADKQSIHELVTAMVLKVSLLMLELRCTECRREDVEQYLTDWMQGRVYTGATFAISSSRHPKLLPPHRSLSFGYHIHQILIGLRIDCGVWIRCRVRFDLDWYYEFCLGRAIGECCAATPPKLLLS